MVKALRRHWHMRGRRSAGLILRSWVKLVSWWITVLISLWSCSCRHGSIVGIGLLHRIKGLGRCRLPRVISRRRELPRVVCRRRSIGRVASVSVGLPSASKGKLPCLSWKPRFEFRYELRIKPGGQLIERLAVPCACHFLDKCSDFVLCEARSGGLPAPGLLGWCCIWSLHHYFNSCYALDLNLG